MNTISVSGQKRIGVWLIILSVVVSISSALFFLTDIFLPQSEHFRIVAKLNGNSMYEIESLYSVEGAVNKKGEFLMRYNSPYLNTLLSLYFDPPAQTGNEIMKDVEERLKIAFPDSVWQITGTDNPYFSGKIIPAIGSFVTSRTVYDSATSSHQEDTFYNRNGDIVWTYTGVKSRDVFRNVITSRRYVPGETSYDIDKFININKFLSQKYGLDADITCNKKEKLIIVNLKGRDLQAETE